MQSMPSIPLVKTTHGIGRSSNGRIERTGETLSRQFSAFRLPRSDFYRSIEEFYSALDSAVALSCLILFRSGEHTQLASKEVHPGDYNCSHRFGTDFAAISFLRKAPFLKTGIDLESVAMASFADAEEKCKVTNRRFRNLSLDQNYSGSNAVLHEAVRRKVKRVLGSFDLGSALDMGSWGPGVTQTVKGSNVSSSRKFREERGITSRAYRLFVEPAKVAYPGWFTEDMVSSLVLQEGNKVITVPKNSKTDRTIGIEPGINSFFQLGVGRLIRLRLRKAGFDLNSDLKNQLGARKGSQDGSLATVDFSSASDTISRELVRSILPEDWFYALDSLRSPCYNLEGVTIPYAKFSAMGNGFTFELESLIFVATALAVCEYLNLGTSDVSVFGDDIIIPSQGIELYREICDYFGFTVNTKKSFSSTYFRESCGSYYFHGQDVKPIFLKEIVSSAKSIYRLANSIRLFSHRRNSNDGCDSKFRPVWRYLTRRLPSTLRVFGPLSSGDATLNVNFDEGNPKHARFGWEGSLHPGFVERAVRVIDEEPSILLAKLRLPKTPLSSDSLLRELRDLKGLGLVSDKFIGNDVTLRSVTRIAYKKAMFAPQWYNFGAWV